MLSSAAVLKSGEDHRVLPPFDLGRHPQIIPPTIEMATGAERSRELVSPSTARIAPAESAAEIEFRQSRARPFGHDHGQRNALSLLDHMGCDVRPGW